MSYLFLPSPCGLLAFCSLRLYLLPRARFSTSSTFAKSASFPIQLGAVSRTAIISANQRRCFRGSKLLNCRATTLVAVSDAPAVQKNWRTLTTRAFFATLPNDIRRLVGTGSRHARVRVFFVARPEATPQMWSGTPGGNPEQLLRAAGC